MTYTGSFNRDRLFTIDPLITRPNPGIRREFATVQALRGIAASIVVLFHINWYLTAVDPSHNSNRQLLQAGAAGVDIFFVISGFVMVLSLGASRGGLRDAKGFLLRRLQRIVPMYWLLTSAVLLLCAAAPNYAIGSYVGTHWRIISSYLFIPAFSAPIVPAGWTLCIEMMFYLMITAALLVRIPIVRSVSAALLLLSLLHPWLLRWQICQNLSTNSILEFAFGMLVARAVFQGRYVPLKWTLPLIALGFAAIATGPHTQHLPRAIYWGLPSLAIIAAATSRESLLGKIRIPAFLLILGDASYSLYLSHQPAIWVVRGIISQRGWHGPHIDALFVFASLAMSLLTGIILYYAVERPIMLWFKRRRKRAHSTNSPAPASSPRLSSTSAASFVE